MTKLLSLKKLFIILTIIILLFMAIVLSWEFLSNYFTKIDLPSVALPENGSKVLIVAPHNDDESLGAALFIERSVKNGALVKVIMITNGDGFSEAVKIHDKKLFAKPSDYIDFGYKRQKETIAALTSLGVDINNIYFLGYPDGGISMLWRDYFNTPYTSKFTDFNTTPYDNSFTPNVAYTGSSLSADITKIMEEFQPDYLVYPHPNDRHPDHWATNAFVKYTLNIIGFKPKGEFLYLIHRGDWPAPLLLDKKLNLEPPLKLVQTGTAWFSLNLNNDEIEQKEITIKEYKTQFPTLENLMLAFIRRNELFGNYPDYQLLNNGKTDSDIIPGNENKIITDPAQDAIDLDLSKGSDLIAIYGEISKENNLHLIMEADGNIEKHISYNLDLIVLKNFRENRIIINVKNGTVSARDLNGKNINIEKVYIKGKYIHILIPHDLYGGYDSMLLNASTSIINEKLDHTALRVIR